MPPPSSPCILAIDPGSTGALVWGTDPKDPESVCRMPADLDTPAGELALIELVSGMAWKKPRVVLERVGGYVGEAQPGSSMFSFGSNDKAVRMALTAAGLTKRDTPTPMQWQKHLTLPKRGRTSAGKAQHKRDLRDLAQSLFPHIRATLTNADALLLYHLAHSNKI